MRIVIDEDMKNRYDSSDRFMCLQCIISYHEDTWVVNEDVYDKKKISNKKIKIMGVCDNPQHHHTNCHPWT